MSVAFMASDEQTRAANAHTKNGYANNFNSYTETRPNRGGGKEESQANNACLKCLLNESGNLDQIYDTQNRILDYPHISICPLFPGPAIRLLCTTHSKKSLIHNNNDDSDDDDDQTHTHTHPNSTTKTNDIVSSV